MTDRHGGYPAGGKPANEIGPPPAAVTKSIHAGDDPGELFDGAQNPRIRIISNGTPGGTTVTVDGKLLAGVTLISWQAQAGKPFATALMSISDVQVDLQVNGDAVCIGSDRPPTTSI